MIIASYTPGEIGRIYYDVDITDENGTFHTVSLQILREATMEEYLDYCKEYGRNSPCLNRRYYYQISID